MVRVSHFAGMVGSVLVTTAMHQSPGASWGVVLILGWALALVGSLCVFADTGDA